jgi:hypothetical protein
MWSDNYPEVWIMKNNKIRSWFDSGDIAKALMGIDDYFVSDVTNRIEHNRILVVRQLLHWADTEAKQSEAAEAIEEAVRQVARKNDLVVMLDLILSFSLVTETDHKTLPIRMDRLIEVACESLRRNAAFISADANLRHFVLKMAERFPDLNECLNLRQ